MFPAHIDYRRTFQILLSLAAGCLFIMAMHVTAQAGQTHTQTFIIPMTEGYGIRECLMERASCGQIVADAWCEAHGLDTSAAYGPAEDITASTGAADAPKPEPGSFIVTCRE